MRRLAGKLAYGKMGAWCLYPSDDVRSCSYREQLLAVGKPK